MGGGCLTLTSAVGAAGTAGAASAEGVVRMADGHDRHGTLINKTVIICNSDHILTQGWV